MVGADILALVIGASVIADRHFINNVTAPTSLMQIIYPEMNYWKSTNPFFGFFLIEQKEVRPKWPDLFQLFIINFFTLTRPWGIGLPNN